MKKIILIILIILITLIILYKIYNLKIFDGNWDLIVSLNKAQNNCIEEWETPNKIQIYASNRFDTYLPVILYTNILYNTLKNKLNNNVEKISNIDLIDINSISLFIIFLIEINDDIIKILSINNIKTIIISTEYYYTLDIEIKIQKLIDNNINFIIFEYNVLNIIILNKIHPSIKKYYLPLLYDDYLKTYYNNLLINKISNIDKDIDILICGYTNERRDYIVNILKNKYNVLFVTTTPENIINYIERSKIILNIYTYDFNKIFDYYRISFLIANNAFIISEYPSDINLDLEPNLIDYDKYMIFATYDKLVETIDTYLQDYNPDMINEIVKNQFEWFSNNKMETYIMNVDEFRMDD
jgi:hypothetical protein